MKVVCISKSNDIDAFRHMVHRPSHNLITPGREYVVYGISIYENSMAFGNGASVIIIDDSGQLITEAIGLFKITDPRILRCWKVTRAADGSICIWPDEFRIPYFFDRLSDGEEPEKTILANLQKAAAAELGDDNRP